MSDRTYEIGDCFYLKEDSIFTFLFSDILDLSEAIFIVVSTGTIVSVNDDENGFTWPTTPPSVNLKATTKRANQLCGIDYSYQDLERHFEFAPFSEEEKEKILSMSLLVSEVDFE